MSSPLKLAAVLVLAAASTAFAEERADLRGAWTIPRDPGSYAPPGTLLLQRTKVSASVDNYRAVLVSTVGKSSYLTGSYQLAATFDGRKLTLSVPLGPLKATDGLSAAVFGTLGAGTTTNGFAKAVYRLTGNKSFDVLRLATASPGSQFDYPGEVRRPKEPDVRTPAEWERSEEILWGFADAFLVSSIYAEAIRGTADEPVRHRIFTASKLDRCQLEYELAQEDAPMDKVIFTPARLQTVWMRDYGPIVLKSKKDGHRIVGDMGYHWNRQLDDSLPSQYAALRGWERRDVESLKLEGGNFMTDGKGRLFVTTRPFVESSDEAKLEREFNELGMDQVVWFEQMPEPEGTGHIDMFAKLMDEKTVLVGKCIDQDRFGRVLDRNAARFESLGYDVVRVTMASGPQLQTYTNSLFVGSSVLVPVYKKKTDKAALATYRSLGWRPVGIDARVIILANGAIHCISMQVPR
jgi:agmatine/peptidylarginine deiminase